MAGRKGSRSSKTDHVLSLLSGGVKEEHAPAPAAEQEAPAAPVPQAAAESTPARTEEPAPAREAAPPAQRTVREGERLTAPILQVAKTNHEALSRTIRDALDQALEEELARQGGEEPQNPGPSPQPDPSGASEEAPTEPEPEPSPVPQPAPVGDPEPEPEPVLNAEPAPMQEEPEKNATEEKSAPIQVPQPQEEAAIPFAPREVCLPDGAVCFNVMELLVDERLERYVKMFGLCSCPRCLADARALALTRLPSKYVVLSPQTAVPMTSLYRAKFESQVIAQVIQACKTVMEFPRHAQ